MLQYANIFQLVRELDIMWCESCALLNKLMFSAWPRLSHSHCPKIS